MKHQKATYNGHPRNEYGYLLKTPIFIQTLTTMDVICIEETAFYALIENVVAQVKDKQNNSTDKWISGTDAMTLLRIKSSTTLQKLRDEGKFRFSQPGRIVLYDRDSINDYLGDFAYETFDLK